MKKKFSLFEQAKIDDKAQIKINITSGVANIPPYLLKVLSQEKRTQVESVMRDNTATVEINTNTTKIPSDKPHSTVPEASTKFPLTKIQLEKLNKVKALLDEIYPANEQNKEHQKIRNQLMAQLSPIEAGTHQFTTQDFKTLQNIYAELTNIQRPYTFSP